MADMHTVYTFFFSFTDFQLSLYGLYAPPEKGRKSNKRPALYMIYPLLLKISAAFNLGPPTCLP
ncbi:hypothetical protein K449DRAFT_384123 [Hypoxylon sp. EC38]|nr:hypothetical protein K449DRAFT_384123 [Hypoxylon sp. EC38]